MSSQNPLYTTFESVKVRLVNKVRFESSTKEEGELPNALLCQLVQDAEMNVEMALRGRYAIPFQSKRTGRFSDLPNHTQRAIRQAVDFQSVILILQTDFGRGTHISAEGYVDPNLTNYKNSIKALLGQDMIGEKQVDRFKITPPLEDLKLASHNKESDDGYRGRIINTDSSVSGAETYAAGQINNPSEGYLSRKPGQGTGAF